MFAAGMAEKYAIDNNDVQTATRAKEIYQQVTRDLQAKAEKRYINIRTMDSPAGAWMVVDGKKVRIAKSGEYQSRLRMLTKEEQWLCKQLDLVISGWRRSVQGGISEHSGLNTE